MISGTFLCNGIALHSLILQFAPVSIKPTVVFVNTQTGRSHGVSTVAPPQWSPATLEAVHNLQTAIERDLAQLHLTNADDCLPLSTDPQGKSIVDFFEADPPSI